VETTSEGPNRTTLLLADDHELMREGLRRLLAPPFEIVASVSDGRAAVSAYRQLRPDLLLLDISLPLLNGIEAARQIKEINKDARIMFVTMQTDKYYVTQAFRAGALGYVVKQSAVAELVDAIHTVLEGRYYLSPLLARKVENFDPSRNPAELFGGKLTPRKREVLQLIAEGKTTKEIASILYLSVRTVEFHKNSIMNDLGLHSTAELTRYALENGIAH
jgi:DNA-binding NarL/FixJ family response regulator